MKRCKSLIFILFCAIATPAFAQTSTINTSWESGKISTSEIYEEEDISGDLTYYKYRLDLKQQLTERLTWSISDILYRKDFDGQHTLCNRFNQATLSVNYLLKAESAFVPAELRFKYLNKEKEYEHYLKDKYKQNNLNIEAIYEQDKNFRLDILAGINDYNYRFSNDKDETQSYLNLDIKKPLLDEKVTLSALYKIKNIQRNSEHDKNQDIWGMQADYTLALPYFKEISLSAQKGKSETLDEEERDDAYDFKYTLWQVKTQHPIFKKLNTSFRYQRTNRNYLRMDKSWKRIWFENTTHYKIIDTKTTDLTLSLKAYHKRLDFLVLNTYDFIKDGASLELKFNKKGSLKIGVGLGFNRKTSQLSPLKNRDAFTWKASIEKTFSELTLFVDYKHELKDYEYAYDRTYDVVKCGMELKF